MPKRGGAWFATNLAAFKKCCVNPRWITTWLQSEHLSLSKAREEYVKCKMNLLSTLPNLEVVERELLREAISPKKRIIEQALRAELCKFRPVPEKDVFLAQLLVLRSRYKLLVLVGISGTGKTVWAKWVFGDEENVLEVNCASCPEPDLR
jgi:transcriptional regulator with GAF, ATPase, and Fis domain